MAVKKVAFIDRDGVINKERGHFYRWSDFEYLAASKKALKMLSEIPNILIVIITGQSGIGRGKYTEADFWKLMNVMKADLLSSGIRIDGIFFCPHPAREELHEAKPPYNVACECRKPQIGLIKQAVDHFAEQGVKMDLKNSCCFGDKTAEVKMAENAGCLGVLVKTGFGGQEPKHRCLIKPDYVAADLLDGVRWWLKVS